MVGEPEVVVGAEVEHLAAVGQRDVGRLRGGDHPLALEQSVVAKAGRALSEVGEQSGSHGADPTTGGDERCPATITDPSASASVSGRPCHSTSRSPATVPSIRDLGVLRPRRAAARSRPS